METTQQQPFQSTFSGLPLRSWSEDSSRDRLQPEFGHQYSFDPDAGAGSDDRKAEHVAEDRESRDDESESRSDDSSPRYTPNSGASLLCLSRDDSLSPYNSSSSSPDYSLSTDDRRSSDDRDCSVGLAPAAPVASPPATSPSSPGVSPSAPSPSGPAASVGPSTSQSPNANAFIPSASQSPSSDRCSLSSPWSSISDAERPVVAEGFDLASDSSNHERYRLIESRGDVSLYKESKHHYVADFGEGSHEIEFSLGRRALSDAQAVGVEAHRAGGQVVFRDDNLFGLAVFNDLGKIVSIQPLVGFQLRKSEILFDQDFDGDRRIGLLSARIGSPRMGLGSTAHSFNRQSLVGAEPQPDLAVSMEIDTSRL